MLVHVEGEAEEIFVNELIAPHLAGLGFCYVSPRLLGNARQRLNRGGIRGWDSARKDIVNHLLEDRGRHVTTMVDYYALPQGKKGKAWPGRAEAGTKGFALKASTVELALKQDVATELPAPSDHNRFIPFVLMHEFEGLLFSDPAKFASGVGRPTLEVDLRAIRSQFKTPEEINDSPETAPSKRIMRLFAEQACGKYAKPLLGCLAALEIGLDKIRLECPHFNSWLRGLEALAGDA